MKCIRKGNFSEEHICFKCGSKFYPGKNKTCPICNWKYCDFSHCGCSLSPETRESLKKFYDLFCNPNNYSKETKFALKIMLKTFYKNCIQEL